MRPLQGRGGCSTKSLSPRDIPEKGTEVKPWGLSYAVGAPLKYDLMVGSEAGGVGWCREAGGVGWGFSPGQAGRGHKCLIVWV